MLDARGAAPLTLASTVAGNKPSPASVAVSGSTQNNDSSAVRKTLPCNGFFHFTQCALLRDLTRRSVALLDIAELAAHSRAAETGMNTHVSPACDGRNAWRCFYLTPVRFL
jgi:hypothetical protein